MLYPGRLFAPNWLHAAVYDATVVRFAYGSSQNSAVRAAGGPGGPGGDGGAGGGGGEDLDRQCLFGRLQRQRSGWRSQASLLWKPSQLIGPAAAAAG